MRGSPCCLDSKDRLVTKELIYCANPLISADLVVVEIVRELSSPRKTGQQVYQPLHRSRRSFLFGILARIYGPSWPIPPGAVLAHDRGFQRPPRSSRAGLGTGRYRTTNGYRPVHQRRPDDWRGCSLSVRSVLCKVGGSHRGSTKARCYHQGIRRDWYRSHRRRRRTPN